MTKPFPALCKDCKWSEPENSYSTFNVCHNPQVMAQDTWTLSQSSVEGKPFGSSCRSERDRRGIFVACGIKGKLWEPK